MIEKLKNALRYGLLRFLAPKPEYGPPTPSEPPLTSMLRSNSPMMTIWPISNGYLLVSASDQMLAATIVYVKDFNEIGEQIAAMRARTAMGITPNVSVRAYANGNAVGANGPSKYSP